MNSEQFSDYLLEVLNSKTKNNNEILGILIFMREAIENMEKGKSKAFSAYIIRSAQDEINRILEDNASEK